MTCRASRFLGLEFQRKQVHFLFFSLFLAFSLSSTAVFVLALWIDLEIFLHFWLLPLLFLLAGSDGPHLFFLSLLSSLFKPSGENVSQDSYHASCLCVSILWKDVESELHAILLS